MTEPQIYLASASPRRRQLLHQIGVHFQCMQADVEERLQPGERTEEFVSRIALAKARAGWAANGRRGSPVLGADTCIELDGEVVGKPRDRRHGMALLDRMSGREHRVLSAVALVAEREELEVQQSRVTFRTITAAERAAYWDTGEPMDKAGAYGIQGLGAIFVERLEGSYSGVMGLPLFETAQLLASFGIAILAAKAGLDG